MTNKSKSTVEAIFPLSYMQQGLLLHHLSSKIDQGFLNTECVLTGDFNIDYFKESCVLIAKRHDVIRSTIHWKNIEKPVHVIHKLKDIEIEYYDWKDLSETEKKEKWETLKKNTLEAGAPLESGALLKIYIIKFSDETHKLLWPMHHILLDGWSGSNILNDLFTIYDALYNNKLPKLDTLPNYKTYLNWINNIPDENARSFWENYLKNYDKASLFSKQGAKNSEETSVTNSFKLSKTETNRIKTYCKKNKITINTLIQCTWSVVLSKYFNTKDVIHGTTVSGRSGDFPNINLLTGMFMNVQPVRGKIDETQDFSNWFQDMQKFQFEARKYEYLSLDKLYSYINWSENSSLFDSLLVFENYPNVKTEENTIKVSNVKSGLTSTYPITLAILPSDEIKFILTTLSKQVDSYSANWILNTLRDIIELITSEQIKSFASLNNKISHFTPTNSEDIENDNIVRKSIYQAPKNKTELELLKIWETLLDKNSISIRDNFFDIGGKSLLAIKMFTLIKKKLNVSLSPITLLEHASIEDLSKYITEEKSKDPWKYIVPIRAKGNKTPIFCIHGGGGYVFFFNPIANALNKDRPVYALQPAGLNNNMKMHKNIQEMAIDYAKEIKDIQSNGPYNLLVYCFSPAVGIEISNTFKEMGEETNLIVIDSIIKMEDFTDPTRIKLRISGFLSRLRKTPISALKLMISNNYERFLEPNIIRLFGSTNKKNLEKIKQNLISIYKQYKWNKKHLGSTTLILTDKPDEHLNPAYIDSWKNITEQKVNILFTKGQHHQLFSSPFADEMAIQIEKSIIEHS